MSSTITLSNTIIAEDKYEVREEILTDEETDFNEEHVCLPRSKKLKACEQERKQQVKERQMVKCAERKSREPGNRLGKNAKKIAGRRAFVDKWTDTETELVEISDTVIVLHKNNYVRIKRKPGHRERAFCKN